MEFAYKQAYAFCPYSPEAIFRYINMLVTFQRFDDALLLATTSFKLDPFNTQIEGLIAELKRIKASMPANAPTAGMTPPVAASNPAAEIVALEAQFKAEPDNLPVGYRLAMTYLQTQQTEQGMAVLDRLVAHPKANGDLVAVAAQTFAQLGQLARVEQCLAVLVKLNPENPEGRFDLAAVQAAQNKSTQAVDSLREALKQNAARRQGNPQAANLYSNALTDDRFASLRQTTQFQQMLDSYKVR
jgi:tetratricopeptide (TPR) repeat protein